MLDDIIDVAVTMTDRPHHAQPVELPPPPLWASRQERYAWRREVFDLLLPELEPWTMDVLFSLHDRRQAPANQATLDAVRYDIIGHLYRAGVADVFTVVTELTADCRGLPCIIHVSLVLTAQEIEAFGEQPLTGLA